MRSGRAQDLQEKYYQKSMEGMGFQQEQAKDAQLMQNFQLRSATENARIKSTTGKDDPYAATVKAIGSFAPAEQARIQKMLGTFGVGPSSGVSAQGSSSPQSPYERLMRVKQMKADEIPDSGDVPSPPSYGPAMKSRMTQVAPGEGNLVLPNEEEMNLLTRDPTKSRAEKLAIMRTMYGFGR
jgi:hypothetical protein